MASLELSANELPQPDWNVASSVRDAIEQVRAAEDAATSQRAYDNLLSALGNNHAGTYFPVVLAAVPILGSVLRESSPWACRSALEALIDLCGSFEPEAGYKYYDGVDLRKSLWKATLILSPEIEALVRRSDEASASAQELLKLLHEPV